MQPQAATTVCHAPAHVAVAYARRQPGATLLYKIPQAHWLGFRAAIETDGGELPAFVRDEFQAYIRSGILAQGFLRVRCKGCGQSRVVAFSRKRRDFCPSCLGRRTADTAAFYVDRLSTFLRADQRSLQGMPGRLVPRNPGRSSIGRRRAPLTNPRFALRDSAP